MMPDDRASRDRFRDHEAPPQLDPRTLALVRVALAVARGDEQVTRDRMQAARGAGVPELWVDELLLQSLLNVGYPLTLAAFATWREIARRPAEGGESLLHGEHGRWARRGERLCAAVYGRTYHKLLLNLRELHPALEALVIVDAYGKVLGRPGLDEPRRELCTLAAITQLPGGTPRQLHAHLRGALNLGWKKEDVDQVLALAEQDLADAARALKMWELWADVRGRKL